VSEPRRQRPAGWSWNSGASHKGFGAERLQAVSFGAVIYALTMLQGDSVTPALPALLPPAAFFFGGLMPRVETQALSGEERNP